MRQLQFNQAVLEATDQCMEKDPSVYIIGLGVPDPKGIFGTTLGLQQKYGMKRVMDMPASENAMTGIAIGSALTGLRPILTHQRVDFMLLSFDQLINNAAKWHYMFNGRMKVPLVVRAVIGQGWGQGPQHSQSLQPILAHIPGLKIVMPATPHDAKGLLIAAVKDDNPVIYLEHRWLHQINGEVATDMFQVPIGKARIAREGRDITIVTCSYMTLESLKAAEILAKDGIRAEVIDLRSLKPLDEDSVLDSVKKTGRLLAAESAWQTLSFSTEILALVSEKAFGALKCAPVRVTFPDVPAPTSPALANHFYPRFHHIVNTARKLFGLAPCTQNEPGLAADIPLDIPDKSFKGPF
ncbi:MAG: transketolase C-terminal domain-containing protein [bacterium]